MENIPPLTTLLSTRGTEIRDLTCGEGSGRREERLLASSPSSVLGIPSNKNLPKYLSLEKRSAMGRENSIPAVLICSTSGPSLEKTTTIADSDLPRFCVCLASLSISASNLNSVDISITASFNTPSCLILSFSTSTRAFMEETIWLNAEPSSAISSLSPIWIVVE